MINKEKEKDFDVIFAFAFGSPGDLLSNYNIAERARTVFEDSDTQIPLITQKDVIFANFPLMYMRRHPQIFITDDRKIGYPSSLKLIKTIVKIAGERNWKKVLVIAAPMHMKRCVRDLRKLGFDAYEDEYLKTHYNMPSIWWYHHNSTQFWTRSGLYWWPREIILRCLSWKIYEWIALR